MAHSTGSTGSEAVDPRISSSPVVTEVFEHVLADVIAGTLAPGQRISDAALAERFGVSRTPVREALQRLREIGVIEASPSRFTRVAEVSPVQTAHAFAVWRPLFATLIEEVVPDASAELAAALELHHAEYVDAARTGVGQAIATANFRFFTEFHEHTTNPILRHALVSVVHLVRLGSLHLPRDIDFDALGTAQARLLTAVRDHDLRAAREAMRVLDGIEVPLS